MNISILDATSVISILYADGLYTFVAISGIILIV